MPSENDMLQMLRQTLTDLKDDFTVTVTEKETGNVVATIDCHSYLIHSASDVGITVIGNASNTLLLAYYGWVRQELLTTIGSNNLEAFHEYYEAILERSDNNGRQNG